MVSLGTVVCLEGFLVFNRSCLAFGSNGIYFRAKILGGALALTVTRLGSNFYYLIARHLWALLDQLGQRVSKHGGEQQVGPSGHFEDEGLRAGSAVPDPPVCDSAVRVSVEVPDPSPTTALQAAGEAHTICPHGRKGDLSLKFPLGESLCHRAK